MKAAKAVKQARLVRVARLQRVENKLLRRQVKVLPLKRRNQLLHLLLRMRRMVRERRRLLSLYLK